MAAQLLIVALIVAACSTYAVWTLMPAALRRAIALRALRLSLPAPLAKPFLKAAGPTSGCGGCGSCGDDAAKPARVQAVKFHPRVGSR
jgi:ferrous iron transport protein B